MPERRHSIRLWHAWAAATILGWLIVGVVVAILYAAVSYVWRVAF